MKLYSRRMLIKKESRRLFIKNFHVVLPVCILAGLTVIGCERLMLFVDAFLSGRMSAVCVHSLTFLLVFFLILLLCPLAAGLALFFCRIADGKGADACAVTSYYNPNKLIRSVKFSLPVIAAAVVTFYTPYVLSVVMRKVSNNMLAESESDILFELISNIGIIAVSILVSLLCSGFMPLLGICGKYAEKTVAEALKMSFSAMRGYRTEFFLFNLSFLPLIAVCYILGGILFIPLFLPYYFITVCVFNNYVLAHTNTPVFYSLS